MCRIATTKIYDKVAMVPNHVFLQLSSVRPTLHEVQLQVMTCFY